MKDYNKIKHRARCLSIKRKKLPRGFQSLASVGCRSVRWIHNAMQSFFVADAALRIFIHPQHPLSFYFSPFSFKYVFYYQSPHRPFPFSSVFFRPIALADVLVPSTPPPPGRVLHQQKILRISSSARLQSSQITIRWASPELLRWHLMYIGQQGNSSNICMASCLWYNICMDVGGLRTTERAMWTWRGDWCIGSTERRSSAPSCWIT